MIRTEESIRQLAEKWGTPLHVFDAARFDENLRLLDCAYKKHYKNFALAYSFKTNYTPALCQRVLDFGGIAEVVSGMEYYLARKLGFPPERIIVNGPAKWGDMKQMLHEGALVMLDNVQEAQRAAEAAAEATAPVRVGFRLNFEIGSGKNSRFGLDAEKEETKTLIEHMRRQENIRIEGIHFHLSGARSKQAWRTRAEKMIAYANAFLREEECRIIDLGSGMFGRMDPGFAAQFDQEKPSFEEYAAAVAEVFADHYADWPAERQPLLVVEPGTTVVADTFSYITKVIGAKDVRGRRIAIVDGGAQQAGELCKKKRLPLCVLSCGGEERLEGPVELTGYTCLEDDILYTGWEGPVAVGDLVCMDNTGAYSNVLKPPFIQTACAMVECGAGEESRLICRPQSYEDVFHNYVF